MTDNIETITITKAQYDSLMDDMRWRVAVESAGVDNWSGYDYAMADYHGEDE